MPRTKLHKGYSDSKSNSVSNSTPKSTSNKKAKTSKTLTEKGIEAQTEIQKEVQLKVETDLMSDFNPTNRKDLSYLGKKQRMVERLEYLDKKLEEINQQLKSDGVRVTIRKGSQNSLVLRATLPVKPEDAIKGGMPTKRYDLSLGIPFNKEGLAEVKTKAYELSRLMTTKTFTWTDNWLGSKSLSKKVEAQKVITFGEALEQFKTKYFYTRKRNRQSESTLARNVKTIKAAIPHEEPFNTNTITKIIQKTEAGSAARFTLVSALSLICNTLELKYDFKGLTNGYEPKEKLLPSDEEVINFYSVFVPVERNKHYQWEAWRWIYGILATYGLRVHEVWAIDLEKFLDPSNVENIITLDESKTEGLKTGEREIFPYHPEWVKLFDLKNVKTLTVKGNLEQKTARVCDRFRKSGIPFTPHTLRHAYAVRGYRLGIPAKEMADSMGHDIRTHTSTYQKYMTLDDRKEIVKKALARGKADRQEKTETQLLKEELEASKKIIEAQAERIKQLETELMLVREVSKM